MDAEELIVQAKRIIKNDENVHPSQTYAEALEFLRIYAGERSSFYKQLFNLKQDFGDSYYSHRAVSVLKAFINHINNGLTEDISIERKAQIDVVSDFLEQANNLLETKKVHAATPTVLIGASLEEFLRNWVEDTGLSIGNQKKSIDSYAKTLKKAGLIDTQDMKDITSWAGLRNHAAHGNWDEVDDKKKISLMLQGVNLFMRKYGK